MSEQDTVEPCVLFVGNLPYAMTDMELTQLFHDNGGVVIAAVARDERERSRGFGFVRFADEAAAAAAVEKYNRMPIDGRSLRVSYVRSDSRYLPLVDASEQGN